MTTIRAFAPTAGAASTAPVSARVPTVQRGSAHARGAPLVDPTRASALAPHARSSSERTYAAAAFHAVLLRLGHASTEMRGRQSQRQAFRSPPGDWVALRR